MGSFIGQSPSRIAEHQRFAAALQQGWRVPFGPLGALTAPLIKIGIRNPFLIRLVAGVLPWLRLRTVLRASCPPDTRGMNRTAGLLALEHLLVGFGHWLRLTRSVCKRRFLIIPARAPPPLGGTRFARSDTPRTPLLY